MIVSFSVEKLLPKIVSGEKTQTMRPRFYQNHSNMKWEKTYAKFSRQQPIMLQLWWKARSPNRKRIFNAPLLSLGTLQLKDISNLVWQFDGFDSMEEGIQWFKKMYHLTEETWKDFQVWVIAWDFSQKREGGV